MLRENRLFWSARFRKSAFCHRSERWRAIDGKACVKACVKAYWRPRLGNDSDFHMSAWYDVIPKRKTSSFVDFLGRGRSENPISDQSKRHEGRIDYQHVLNGWGIEVFSVGLNSIPTCWSCLVRLKTPCMSSCICLSSCTFYFRVSLVMFTYDERSIRSPLPAFRVCFTAICCRKAGRKRCDDGIG